MIASPDDLDAHYTVKRSMEWTGYKVHSPRRARRISRLITHVETTTATIHDSKVASRIQDALAAKDRSPDIHLVDEGYMEMDLLVESQHRGIDLVGPIPASKTWQDRVEGAFDHTQFHIDWQNLQITCPAGKTSIHRYASRTARGIQLYLPLPKKTANLVPFATVVLSQEGGADPYPQEQ
jgi:transposase